MKNKTIKTLKSNRNTYELFIARNKDGTVKKVTLWESLSKQLLTDTGIRKINGVLVDNNNNIVNGNDFREYIYAAIENCDDKLANSVAKTIEGSAEDTISLPDKEYIVLTNGRYAVKTGKFEAGSFDSINKVPWNYNPAAVCPLGKEIMKRYEGTNKGFTTQVFEAMGLMMAQEKDYKFKKSIFFNGVADSGKSFLFENMIQPAIGDNNIGLIEFGEIDEKEIAALINKTGGYDSDMYKGKMSDKSINKFKKVVGDTKLKAKLLYKDQFEFQNYATIWINCNGLPKIIDRGSGDSIKTRVHVIQATVNMRKQYSDPDISDKVHAVRQELSEWMIKEALEALTAAIARGTLTTTIASEEAIDIEINNADAVTTFIRYYAFPEKSITVAAVYQEYANTFILGGNNVGDNQVGRNSFIATLRDMQAEKGIRVFLSGGQNKVEAIKQSNPWVRNFHGDLVRKEDLDAEIDEQANEAELMDKFITQTAKGEI